MYGAVVFFQIFDEHGLWHSTGLLFLQFFRDHGLCQIMSVRMVRYAVLLFPVLVILFSSSLAQGSVRAVALSSSFAGSVTCPSARMNRLDLACESLAVHSATPLLEGDGSVFKIAPWRASHLK